MNDWQSDNYPVIYDEGDETLKYVKTGVKNNIDTGGSSYLVYTALLKQTGTNAPQAQVLENTLGGTVVWEYTNVGLYTGTLAAAFTANKTSIQITNWFNGANQGFARCYISDSPNSVQIECADITGGSNINNLLGASFTNDNCFIEIRVYP